MLVVDKFSFGSFNVWERAVRYAGVQDRTHFSDSHGIIVRGSKLRFSFVSL